MKKHHQGVNNILGSSWRPVVLLGNTISHPLSTPPPIPIVVSGTESLHLVQTDHKFFIGKYGKTGDRAGNMAVQNADIVLVLGHVDIETRKEWFAREAHIIVISGQQPDQFLSVVLHYDQDPNDFLKEWVVQPNPCWNEWIFRCRQWKSRWLMETPPSQQSSLDLYIFHALLQQHYHHLCRCIVAHQDNWFWCPLHQQMIIDENPRHLYGVKHDNTLEHAHKYIKGIKNPVLVFSPHINTIHPRDIARIEKDEPPFIIFLVNVEGRDKFKMNKDGYYDLADEGVLLEKITKTPFININIDNVYDVLNTLHEVKTPIFVWVECGSFSPYPVGVLDRPPEEMTPRPDEMLNEMIVPPVE